MDQPIVEILQKIFRRNLGQLKKEVEQYKDEKNLWVVDKSISNSAGNLCLHLIGNLKTYIGGEVGKTGYVRDRPLEFSDKDVPKARLMEMIDEASEEVVNSLSQLNPERLQAVYPRKISDNEISTEYMMVHLLAHLNYHLGQVNYHRRLLDE